MLLKKAFNGQYNGKWTLILISASKLKRYCLRKVRSSPNSAIKIRSSPNSAFNVHNPHETKLLTRLRVGLSHLRKHKFRHNFKDSRDIFSNYSRHLKRTIHFFPHCSNHSDQRKTLFNKKGTSNVLYWTKMIQS